MTTAKRRNSNIFLEKIPLFKSWCRQLCFVLGPLQIANKIVHFVQFENVWLWRRRPTVGDVWFSRRRRLRRTRGRLAFVLVIWIDGKFFWMFGNGKLDGEQMVYSDTLLPTSFSSWCLQKQAAPFRNSSQLRIYVAPSKPQEQQTASRVFCHSATAKDLLRIYDNIRAGPRICLDRRSCIRNTNDTPFFTLSR